MSKPRLLDLFCCAGGAGMGYHRAGFEVVGVDLEPQPRYPFEFHQADALDVLTELAVNGKWATPASGCRGKVYGISAFAAIHASPPCQAYSHGTAPFRADGTTYPDLLGPTRERLIRQPVPWVIENVPGAPMRADYVLCGSMFGLPGLIRHRLFETSWHGFEMCPPCHHEGLTMDAPTGHGGTRRAVNPVAAIPSKRIINPTGHGATSGDGRWWREERPEGVTWIDLCREAMGIDWMNRDELSEAIPPAYTEWIGTRLLEQLEAVAS